MKARPLILLAAVVAALAALTLAGCGRDRQSGASRADTTATARPRPIPWDTTGGVEAAASHILVWYRGCTGAPDTVTRTRVEAEERARRIAVLAREPGADFAALARRYSDDPAAGRTGGYLGIVGHRELTLPFEVVLFRLREGMVSQVVETDYGWHVIKREPVLRARAHHILVAWQGATSATEAVTRTKEQARSLAEEVRLRAAAPGADLCALARRFSDDAGNSADCGDLGVVVPGWLPRDFEEELFRLRPGRISPVVETAFGFHVVWRDS